MTDGLPGRRWVDRRFALGLGADAFPDLVERVRGTPARLEERLRGVATRRLAERLDGAWSMLENAGHLLDLEPLWDRRLDELLGGAESLEPADMTNRRTEEAGHNARPADELLAAFRAARGAIVERLESLSAADLERSALHPRLEQPMTVTDLTFFVAEHDDHHLARISAIRRRPDPGVSAAAPRDHAAMLAVAIDEARRGLEEGGVPIGAALFTSDGELLGRGRNRRVQEGDPSVHGETDAFRKAGRQTTYRDKVMVTTLAPCWYCSGLVRQFGIGTVVVGESVNFAGGLDWLRGAGVEVVDMASEECVEMLRRFIAQHPNVWNEDIGEPQV